MLRRNREINIFNMSALDLFASALGAFILLTVMLLPYYLKTDKSQVEKLQQQQQEIQQLKEQNQALEQQSKDLQSELESAVSFALLGITTKSKSFVLVIDMSGSMEEYADIMIKTVSRVLEPMKNENQIQIIGYQGEENPSIHSWKKPHQLTSIDSTHKQDALRWAKLLEKQFSGSTPTHAALIEALKYPSEAIILLTDGAPNNDPAKIISDITSRNGGSQEIHCVALGDYRANPALVTFLEALAKANNGGFVGVSN